MLFAPSVARPASSQRIAGPVRKPLASGRCSPEQPRARPKTHLPTLRGFSITVGRLLVGAKAEEHGMTHLAFRRPLRELHLSDELRLDPGPVAERRMLSIIIPERGELADVFCLGGAIARSRTDSFS